MIIVQALDAWLEANGHSEYRDSVSPGKGYLLKDSGEGNYIAEWHAPVSQPAESDVEAYQASAALNSKREQANLDRESFMLALKQAGIYGQAMAYAKQLDEGHDWRIRWEHASSFRRTDPDLIAGAKDMGLTDSDLDAIFGIE